MKTSETTVKVYSAFIKAQGQFSKATKDSTNPFFKSKYADLNSYLDAISDSLTDNGLAVLQDTSGSEQGQIIRVSTRLIHTSGEWMESEPLVLHPIDMKPQSFGSAQTYGRRYSLSSFLGLGAEDDDGQRASKPKPVPTRATINKELLAIKTIEEFDKYVKSFLLLGISWDANSGKAGGAESNAMLFAGHKKRINGEPPVEANKSPEDLQSEFDGGVNACDNTDVLNELNKLYANNPCLKTDANRDILTDLENKLDFLGGS